MNDVSEFESHFIVHYHVKGDMASCHVAGAKLESHFSF